MTAGARSEVEAGEPLLRNLIGAMRRAVVILATLIATSGAAAQQSIIRGIVSDSSGAGIPSAAVVLDDLLGARAGTTTDSLGRFAFLTVLPGTYLATASHLGYEDDVDTVFVGFDEHHLIHLVLMDEEQPLGEITVSESAGGGSARSTSRYQIRPEQLSRLPSPGLSVDLMSYLSTVPGAVRVGDTGGQLFIRGGTPTQNLVLIDGMPLYQPFHIVGFYSAFPAGIISFADVYAGGFGARYGGRLSSVIDVTTRNGNKRRVAGEVSLAPFLSAARIELPLVRDKASLLVSARESVIERLGPMLSDADFPFRFGDYFAKFHAFLNQTSSFSATAIQTFDRGAFDGAAGTSQTISWQNRAIGGRYVYLPQDYPVMTQLAVYVSSYENRHVTSTGERRSETTGINGDISFTYLLGAQQLDFGIFGRSNSFDYAFGRSRVGRGLEHVTEGGGYIDFSLAPTPSLAANAGVRAHAFSSGIGTSVEPRFQVQYEPIGRLKGHVIGLAWGLYHQQIVGLSAVEDLTDLFIAWTPAESQRPIPKAMHLIGSWQAQVSSRTAIRLEPYLKTLANLATPRYDRLTNTLMRIDALEGIARGVDLQVEHSGSWHYLLVGYGLAEVNYEGLIPWPPGAGAADNRVREFHPSHDRRHQLNVAAQVEAGKFRLNVLWQYASGHPFTQIHGFYPMLDDPPRDDTFHSESGVTGVVLGEPFGERMPPYHRLDLSVERSFTADPVAVAVQIGVVNAYDRGNLFNFDLLTGERSDQLPLIPYAGVRVTLD